MTSLQIRSESLDLEAALRFHSTIKELKLQAHSVSCTCHAYITKIQEATESGNAQQIEEIGRGLVDALTTLSPPAALDLALLLERQGRSNTLTDTKQTIHNLKTELDRLQQVISDL